MHTDYNNNIICECILILSTRALPDIFASLTGQMPIKPLHTIPTVAQKAVDGAEEGHQSNCPHRKPTLTSAQAKRVDTLGIKFEDLLNLYLESTTREAYHTILKEREASIASHCRRSSRKRPLECAQLTVSFTPAISYCCRTLRQRSHQIAIDLIDVVLCVLSYHGKTEILV